MVDRLWRVLDGPLAGLVPWIVLAVFEGPGRILVVAVVALALSLLFVVADLVRGRSLKLLGLVDVGFFASLVVVHFALGPGGEQWMETWVGELANIVLVLIAAGSMLAGVPFTIQYAREQVAEEYWQTPLFVRVNYVITGAWALAFLVAAVAGFYGDTVLRESDNVWTGWVIQTAAMVGAIRFTGWYPDFARAKATAVEAN